jgi:hypothetical protein
MMQKIAGVAAKILESIVGVLLLIIFATALSGSALPSGCIGKLTCESHSSASAFP